MFDDNEHKAIFIGGTGRSGTTILSQYLGSHEAICQIPFESKFLVDKDGALDLFTSLSTNFSVNQGKLAIRRFENLLINYMGDPYSAPYVGYNLTSFVERDLFHRELGKFIASISNGEWLGWDKHTHDKLPLLHCTIRVLMQLINKISIDPINRILSLKGHEIPRLDYKRILSREPMYIPRYFEDTKELCEHINNFVATYFFAIAQRANKSHFCEATPANMLHLEFLGLIFPKAYFLHAVRHPIGVAQSLMEKTRHWSPNQASDVVNYLTPLYEKLIVNERYAREHGLNYKILRLEDFDSCNFKNELNEYLGINNAYSGEVIFRTRKVNYWENELHSDISLYLNDKLFKYINYYGYQ